MAERSTASRYGAYTTPRVRNPTRYQLLCARFGKVMIANAGEATVFGTPRFNMKSGQIESTTTLSGEFYRIACPFCADTRHRLYVNYR